MEQIKLEDIVAVVKKESSLMVTDHFEVMKTDGYANIVTSSDVAVQKFLCVELSTLLPGCGFICEEEDMYTEEKQYTWIIDPIDGTANYSRGIPECAISVALKKDADIIMGVVYNPYQEALFTAQKEAGAFYNGRKIEVSQKPFENGILCCALSLYHKQYTDICSRFIVKSYSQCNDVRRFGAASLEICYLAMGRCDLYFEYMLSPWDYAAASLVLTEAGGCLCAYHGETLQYKKPTMVMGANSKQNLERLVEIYKEIENE
ncbi:MAG: hypothetical protein MJZ16_03915 [Bacteroidales bacterium]|nr:hypothetical protein [Bacteroidales bacterium]